MTEKEAMESPLHEVWAVFKLKNDKFARKHLEELDDVDWAMLRRVLLERCGVVSDESGMTSMATFEMVREDDGTFSEKNMCCIMAHDWCGEAKQLRNFAAACMFWAWELEQRERESGKPIP